MDNDIAFAVFHAITADDIKRLLKVIAGGANINIPLPETKMTPIMYAAFHNNVAAVKILMMSGADISARDIHGRTALYYGTGSLEIVAILLSAGIFVDTIDENMDTPLMRAVRDGNIDVCARLVTSGASKTHANDRGMTAFHIATIYNRKELYMLLAPSVPNILPSSHGQPRYNYSLYEPYTPSFYKYLV